MSAFKNIFKKPIDFVELKAMGLKEGFKENLGDGLSKAIVFGAIGVVSLFALAFLSTALALALNAWLDDPALGYVIVGSIYLIGAIVLFTQKDKNFIYNRSQKYARLLMKRRMRKGAKELNKIVDEQQREQKAIMDAQKVTAKNGYHPTTKIITQHDT